MLLSIAFIEKVLIVLFYSGIEFHLFVLLQALSM